MPTDLERIKELLKLLGIEMEGIEYDKVWGSHYFSMDKAGRVTELNLNNLELEKLPPIVSELKYLDTISLIDAGLKDISVFSGLSQLKFLDLRNNSLNDISVLSGLSQLQVLDLSNNQLSDISALSDLSRLQRLNLSNNRLNDISVLSSLSELYHLDLRNNRIKSLPEKILDLNLDIRWVLDWGISLEGNPLVTPPIEIVKQGKEAIRAYFKLLKKGELRRLNEVKALLVGDGGVGKTSLSKRLMDAGFDIHEPQTHGILIKKWNIKKEDKKIKVNLWDFGGQEIMHATHQFFLSRRCLYILVLDSRKDEKTEYWLKHVKSIGGDSPVIVVLNKIDENPGFEVNRPFLQEKYKNIKGFFRISCKENEGIQIFSQALKLELSQIELIETVWPENWFQIKGKLEKMEDHYIGYEQFKAMCEKEEITQAFSRETLVEFLNDLGVCIHFSDFELHDTHVLEPKWITGAVYKIVNSPLLARCNGIFKLKDLDRILEKEKDEDYYYPRDKYPYIIKLMKKFELCYEIDSETILLPQLLEVTEPTFDFDYEGALKFIIQYDFLPRSTMPRFIVNMHLDIKNELRWRTGVVLNDRVLKTTAVITADYEASKIYIFVSGEQKRDYFSVIRYTLSSINQSFEKLGVQEMVPCTCPVCVETKTPNFYKYNSLVLFRNSAIHSVPCDISAKQVTIDQLIEGIERPRSEFEEEVLLLLKKRIEDSDTHETLLKKANDLISVNPSIFGVGINVNNLVKKVMSWKQKKSKKK